MQVLILAIGKVKEPGLRELIEDYLGRISRYARCQQVEIKDGPADQVGKRLLKLIPERAKIVALEVDGERWTSERLARFVGDCENHSVPAVVFLIGGAYGLPPDCAKQAHIRLSLSNMTLPHRLARLFLAEQIYRAFTILRNEPYSH